MEEVTDTGAGARRDLSALLVDVARALSRAGSARPLAALRAGVALSECLELVRGLGRRGSGALWEARDLLNHRSVAVRFLRPRARWVAPLDPALAEALAGLEHPNIAGLQDAGILGAAPYLVQELVRGEPLEAALARGPLEPERALAIAIDVAKALAQAHAAGILHRDLTPSNVVLTEGGAKVLGFGLALLLGGPGADRDDPRRVPPERRRGKGEDGRTDVWALGALLHEMLCGEPPPAPGVAPATAPIALPGGSLFPGLPELVERMTADAPAERPRDGVDALAELLHQHDVWSVRRATRWGSRLTLPTFAALLVAIGLVSTLLRDAPGALDAVPAPEALEALEAPEVPAAAGPDASATPGSAAGVPDRAGGAAAAPAGPAALLAAAACGQPSLDEKKRAIARVWQSAPVGGREEALHGVAAACPGDEEVLSLTAEAFWHAGTPGGPAQAAALFRRALDLDPDDARARAHLLEWTDRDAQ